MGKPEEWAQWEANARRETAALLRGCDLCGVWWVGGDVCRIGRGNEAKWLCRRCERLIAEAIGRPGGVESLREAIVEILQVEEE